MWYFHYSFLILLWLYGVLCDSIQIFELFYSCEKCHWKFYRDFINLYIAFGSMDNLTLVIPISWAWNIIFVSHRRSKHVWTKAEFITFPTKPGSTSMFSSLVIDPSIHQWQAGNYSLPKPLALLHVCICSTCTKLRWNLVQPFVKTVDHPIAF